MEGKEQQQGRLVIGRRSQCRQLPERDEGKAGVGWAGVGKAGLGGGEDCRNLGPTTQFLRG